VIVGLSNVAEVSAGQDNTCARTTAGAVYCWGSNFYGTLGLTDASGIVRSPVAVALPGGLTATQIVTGGDSACALLSDQTVVCWGYGGEGEIGWDAGVAHSTATPNLITGLTSTTKIYTGSDSDEYCAINAGVLECWGYNGYGELGLAQDAGDGGDASVYDNNPHPIPAPVVF
jgi:alpha-tubulin suppressor-like RCC1 family protein